MSGILTVQEVVQAKTILICWLSPKNIYPILKLNFEVVNILMKKMLVCPDSRRIYRSFGT